MNPSVSNEQAPGSLEVHPRREGMPKKPPSEGPDRPRKSPVATPAQGTARPEHPAPEHPRAEQASPDEGFSRFYNTFGNLIQRLSAPLAYAGLPLISEESTSEPPPVASPEPQSRRRSKQPSVHGAVEPDLGKIYSRATLRSLSRDGHGPMDSFYVVPTSGHTATYARILNHESKEKRRLAASVHAGPGDRIDSDDEYYGDARELSVRRRAGKFQTDRDVQNVVEELHLENTSLKEMLDKLSKRLHAFELNSQSSHLALAQSIRLQRDGSPAGMSSSAVAGQGQDVLLRKRNLELEEQMEAVMKQMLRLEQDLERKDQTLERYRDRWERLKAGAKARRDAQDQGQSGDNPS